MSQEFTNVELLRELEPVAEKLINRHMSMFKEWNPHDYIPWKEGKNYYALGGQDWDPRPGQALRGGPHGPGAEPAHRGQPARLPSRDRDELLDGRPWGYWVNRWTAEENRHGISIRDYLVVTRTRPHRARRAARGADDPRFSPGQNQQGDLFADTLFDSVMYVSFQELATRVSHRNTGKACNDPVAEQLLARISNDENLHMIFYRDVSAAGLDIAPTWRSSPSTGS